MTNVEDLGKVCSRGQPAVVVRNSCKHFGSKSKPNPVFVNLNMTVTKGTIYGLLGASGCGKTTLLSCLVGKRKLNSGEMCVLGGKPGTKVSGVPGKRVGYMPQELALYGAFTIEETMMYFGWIFGMETDAIVERLKFLSDFLDLPSKSRLVKSLSGGQQRRLSFAVALLHDPELLILDEPTVGVDPLLRQSIWRHLVHITKAGQKTIIITTHYIEEARQAHTVIYRNEPIDLRPQDGFSSIRILQRIFQIGLMRSGRLLSEESPHKLLIMYRCSNLEDVFLKLSRNQDTSNEVVPELNASKLAGPTFGNKKVLDAAVCVSQESGVVGIHIHQGKETPITYSGNGSPLGVSANLPSFQLAANQFDDKSEEINTWRWSNITTKGKMRALKQKNFLRTWRSIGLMFFIFALPVSQVIIFCFAIGRDPTGLTLAIVNMEMNGTECNFEPGCHLSKFSGRYLNHLNERILRKYYGDQESEMEAVKTGQSWGSVYFGASFTSALAARMALGRAATDEIFDRSEIRIWLDMSNQQIGSLLDRDLQLAYTDFIQSIFKDCNYNPKLGELPLQFEEPIYGTSTPTFTDFVAPGVILTIIFFLAVAMTSTTLVVEKTEGLFDRSLVAGVSPGEILFSHILNQLFVMFGQTALLLIFMIYVFGITCKGDMLPIILVTLLAGMCGMCYGFVISTVCESVQTAMPVALGSYYPIVLLCGTIWPLEGMTPLLRYISNGLPLTQAVTALRSILTRGWGFSEPEVYLGFVGLFAWIILFLVIAFVMLKIKRR